MRSFWSLALLVAAACAHPAPMMHSHAMNPELDLEAALTLFRHGEYDLARPALRRAQFEMSPAQPEVAEARYFLAECDFQTSDYAAAAVEFHKVAEEFPSSEYASLALLRSGDANLRLWRAPELDPEPGQAALATYQELAGRYPGSGAAARAQLHVAQLNDWFALKDYKNGMFYFQRHAYDSAIIYFKDIIANYSNTRLVSDALLRLVDSYRAIRYAEEMREACTTLRQYYPKTTGLDLHCPRPAAAPAPGTP
jgi:outer membrane assembly lipoprotein YfiO